MGDRKNKGSSASCRKKELSPNDETGLPDPMLLYAVKRIMEKEKKAVAESRSDGG